MDDLSVTLKRSSNTINESITSAEDLQQLLLVLIRTALESNAQLAVAQEASLEQVTSKANNELNALITVVATAAASSASLQQQIVGQHMRMCYASMAKTLIGHLPRSSTSTFQQAGYRAAGPGPAGRCNRNPLFQV